MTIELLHLDISAGLLALSGLFVLFGASTHHKILRGFIVIFANIAIFNTCYYFIDRKWGNDIISVIPSFQYGDITPIYISLSLSSVIGILIGMVFCMIQNKIPVGLFYGASCMALLFNFLWNAGFSYLTDVQVPLAQYKGISFFFF